MTEIPIRYDFPLFVTDCPIRNYIGSDKLRLSDSWSLFQYVVLKRGKTEAERKFMLTLLEQAKYFYSVADSAPLKSKPLLYYYSFLNLAKLFINLRGYIGNTREYNHGIEARPANSFVSAEVNVKGFYGSPMLPVNRVFAEQLGFNYPTYPFQYKVVDYLKACVGIHKVYCETYKQEEMFHRIKDLHLFMHANQMKSVAWIPNLSSNDVANLTAKGYSITHDDAGYVWTETIAKHPHHLTNQNFFDLSLQMRQRGLWYLTNGNEYRMYISAQDYAFPPELVIYNIMFYFGSITRYHPYQFDELLSAKEQWMVEVFMRTQPQQFVYGLLSRLLGRYVYEDKTAKLSV